MSFRALVFLLVASLACAAALPTTPGIGGLLSTYDDISPSTTVNGAALASVGNFNSYLAKIGQSWPCYNTTQKNYTCTRLGWYPPGIKNGNTVAYAYSTSGGVADGSLRIEPFFPYNSDQIVALNGAGIGFDTTLGFKPISFNAEMAVPQLLDGTTAAQRAAPMCMATGSSWDGVTVPQTTQPCGSTTGWNGPCVYNCWNEWAGALYECNTFRVVEKSGGGVVSGTANVLAWTDLQRSPRVHNLTHRYAVYSTLFTNFKTSSGAVTSVPQAYPGLTTYCLAIWPSYGDECYISSYGPLGISHFKGTPQGDADTDITSGSAPGSTTYSFNSGPYNGQLLATDPNQQLYGKSLKTFWIDAIDSPTTGGGGASGDPQISGLRGQSFQVHGIDGAVYNLITDHNIQVNGRFSFLDYGRCALTQTENCWSHAGSYISEVGLQFRVGDVVYKVHLVAGPYTDGFEVVRLNGLDVNMGVVLAFDYEKFMVNFTDAFTVVVDTPAWTFEFSSSDMFMNHKLWSKTPLNRMTSHGIIGQTWQRKVYNTKFKHMQGDVDDYLVVDEIWGKDFVFNLFTAVDSGIVAAE